MHHILQFSHGVNTDIITRINIRSKMTTISTTHICITDIFTIINTKMFQFLCLIINIIDTTSSTRERGRVFEADQCLLAVVMVTISARFVVVGDYIIFEEAFFTLFDLCVTVVCLLIIGRCSIVETTSVDITDISNNQYSKDKLDTHYCFL